MDGMRRTDDGVSSHQSEVCASKTLRSFFSRHGRKLIAVAVTLAAVVSVAIAVTFPDRKSPSATAFANANGVIFPLDISSEGVESTADNDSHPNGTNPSNNATINSTNPSPGNTLDFTVLARNQELIAPQSTFGANDCSIGEGLWNLQLVTDDYPWETKWELYGNSDESSLFSGPREGTNYEPRTRYTGNLCLPTGRYYMRWYDRMRDGLCCKYGRGEWTVTVNGEVVLKNDETNSNFAQKDFPFQIAGIGGGEMTGTFLILPRPIDPINPVMNVEFADGTMYELLNLPIDFSYADIGLVSGVSSIALPLDAGIFSNGTVDMKGKAPRVLNRRLFDKYHKEVHGEATEILTRRRVELRNSHLHRHRRLANYRGDQTVLAVRVIAADGTTTADETSLGNNIFGNGVDPVNLVSQIGACSYGKMNLIKAQSKSGWSKNSGNVLIYDGIVTVSLPFVSTAQGHAFMRNAITKELNDMFGVESPSQLANYVLYCLPPGSGIPGAGIAYAYINSWLSVFNDDWSKSVTLQMHELGHSMNFGHSNEGGVSYEDYSGIMGASYPNSDNPLTCFNAAKSWQTGWYRDKGVTINSSGKTACFAGILRGVADYPVAGTVLLRVQNGSDNDYYINFNSKKGINGGTQEGGNQVTVVSRARGPRDSYAESELVAKLGHDESFSILGYTVIVGAVDTVEGTADVMVLPTGQDDCAAEDV